MALIIDSWTQFHRFYLQACFQVSVLPAKMTERKIIVPVWNSKWNVMMRIARGEYERHLCFFMHLHLELSTVSLSPLNCYSVEKSNMWLKNQVISDFSDLDFSHAINTLWYFLKKCQQIEDSHYYNITFCYKKI